MRTSIPTAFSPLTSKFLPRLLALPSRASKSWLDRFLTSSMGTFNESAAYNSQAEGAGGSLGASSTAAAADTPAQAGPQPLRDIVTGELLPAGNGDGADMGGTAGSSAATGDGAASSSGGTPPGPPALGRRPVGGSASSKLGVQPPRDIRLEPVQQIASWLGSSSPPSGTAPRQPPEQGSGGNGGESA